MIVKLWDSSKMLNVFTFTYIDSMEIKWNRYDIWHERNQIQQTAAALKSSKWRRINQKDE